MPTLSENLTFDPELFSLNDPVLAQNPYPAYEWMRRNQPVFFSPMYGGSWSFFKHDDVKTLLVDTESLNTDRSNLPLDALPPSERQQFKDMIDLIGLWMAFFDGRAHTVRRRHLRAVWDVFTPDQLRPRLTRIIDEILPTIRPAGSEFDVVADFAAALPAMSIAELLGVPTSDHALLSEWADPLAFIFGSSEIAPDDVARAHEAVTNLVNYFSDLRPTVLRDPDRTMLGRLLTWETDGYRFTETEAYAQCILLIFAGSTPSRHVIANSVHALATHPEQQRQLRNSPNLMRSAVEELFRYDTPNHFIGRRATTDFNYGGHEIEEGQLVLLYAGSANRDEAAFDRPDELILDRGENQHMTFGRGAHYCIGAGFVRVQTELALDALMRLLPSFELADPERCRYNPFFGLRGFESVPLRVDPDPAHPRIPSPRRPDHDAGRIGGGDE
jgi:cytochrome P450